MICKLTHPFLRRCIDSEALLKNCSKFDAFSLILKKQAEKKATGGDGEIDGQIENEYKGDGFELFVEMLICMFGANFLIGIYPDSYSFVDPIDDNGVDGTGIGLNGKIHTVQIKFRNGNYILTANEDHLSNFKATSLTEKENGGFGVDGKDRFINKNFKDDTSRDRIHNTCNMIIIHSGKEINKQGKKTMFKEVKEFTRADICRCVDGNLIFWNSFIESWDEAIKKGY